MLSHVCCFTSSVSDISFGIACVMVAANKTEETVSLDKLPEDFSGCEHCWKDLENMLCINSLFVFGHFDVEIL